MTVLSPSLPPASWMMISVFDEVAPEEDGLLSKDAAASARVKIVGMNAPTETTARPLLTKSRRVSIATCSYLSSSSARLLVTYGVAGLGIGRANSQSPLNL